MYGFFLGSYFRIILVAALLPVVVLMVLVYRQDRVEREPFSVMLRLFLLGAATTVGASLIERLCISFLNVVYPNVYSIAYGFLMYFCIVAVAEEGLKYAVLRSMWRHPAFNYRFDAVVYGTCASLGFAAAENLLYILQAGVGIAPIRAVTAIPLHCICGIYMGHYFGMARACENYGMRGEQRIYHILTLLIPVLIHGFYDFAATSGYGILQAAFTVFIVVLDITAIINVRKYARHDAPL
ncbi:MAG: PrsW family intramembrane metalloprotease [Lachnospiraceae bacterium]|nr:PrsW family intramembrane metalloprotease [Lachnospiraceae bacterium]